MGNANAQPVKDDDPQITPIDQIFELLKEDITITESEMNHGSEIIIKCSVKEMMRAFFLGYVIVWHDPNVNNEENQKYIAQLKKFCEVFTFTEWNKARDYIKTTQAVCHVITSGTNGELLVKGIFKNENVCNIYVFCGNKEYHLLWAKDYDDKVSCVETDIEDILDEIRDNLLEWYKKASSLNTNLPAFAPIFNDSDKSEMNNLHRYLKVIPKFKSREQAKKDFLILSKQIFSDEENLKFLDEFEQNYNEYNLEQTFRWYSQESFLYKVTNNCLRIATSDSIQYCRLLLRDIEKAIKEQYRTKSRNFKGLLYRGAYLSQKEWENLKENKDKEVEMHGFLSVSKEKNVALDFMEVDPSKKVFITIIVPKGPNQEEQGFAEIEEFSRFPAEKEILFNVRSRFTVLETEDDFEYSQGEKCRHLVLLYGAQGFRKFITKGNPIQKVTILDITKISCSHCKAQSVVMPEKLLAISISHPRRYFCKACIEHGTSPFLCVTIKEKPQEAFTVDVKGCFLQNEKNQTPFYGYRCSQCQKTKGKYYLICTNCGGKKYCEGCFSVNSACSKAGHQILLETSPFTFWCEKMSASELNHLQFHNKLIDEYEQIFPYAEMFFESHQYEKAKEYYSLYIKQNEGKQNDVDLAICYNKIGDVCYKQGDYKTALEYYQKPLDILKNNVIFFAMSYHNIGKAYFSQGEDKKALEFYFKSLEINESLYGNSNAKIADSYSSIGYVYNRQGDSKKALQYHLKALKISKSVHGENHPNIGLSYNDIGTVYKNQGEYNKALEYYLKALDILKSFHGKNHPAIALAYKEKGQVHQLQKDFAKTLECYLKALEINKSLHGENHHEIISCHDHLGSLHTDQGDYIKALESYSKALDMKKSLYGENHLNIGLSYKSFGMVFHLQKEYIKAFAYYSKALMIFKPILGENSAEVAKGYSSLATVFKDKGEYEKGLEYYLQSLEIFQSLKGENSSEVAASYHNIATLYQNQKDNKKALEYFLKSLEIYKSINGENHSSVANSSKQIGTIYYLQKEYKKALEYYAKVMEIDKSLCEENYPDIVLCYSNVGRVHQLQKEYPEALEYYLKSLEIYRSIHGGENHVDVALSFHNIGLVYFNQTEYKKALEYYFKSLDIRKSVYGGENHVSVASSCNNIGTAYFRQKEYLTALEYYLKSLDIRKSVFGGENHADVAQSYYNIGLVSHHQKEYQKALENYFKSLEIRKSVFGGENHADVAQTYYNIGKIHYLQKQYTRALEYYLKVFDIEKLLYGENHSELLTILDSLGVLHQDQGEGRKALEYYVKASKIAKTVYGNDHQKTRNAQNRILKLKMK